MCKMGSLMQWQKTTIVVGFFLKQHKIYNGLEDDDTLFILSLLQSPIASPQKS